MKSKGADGRPELSSDQQESGEPKPDGPSFSERNSVESIMRLRQITEHPALLPPSTPVVVGKAGFNWREELSEGGRKLYGLLIREMGDVDLLATFAADDEFDCNAAMNELRNHGLLDETDPRRVSLIHRQLS
jgi:hypothetical protein